MSAFITAGTDYISATYVTTATQPMTLMCRVWLPNATLPAGGYRNILVLDPNMVLQIFSDGLSIDFGTVSTDNVGPLLNINNWYHVAYVCIPTTTTSRQIYGYLNGAQVVNVTDTATFTATTRLVVGNQRSGTANYGLLGNVKDVRVWTRAMTATEVIDEMDSVVPVHDEGLISYLALDNSLVRDSGSSRLVWTNTAGVVLQHGGMRGAYPARSPRTLRI